MTSGRLLNPLQIGGLAAVLCLAIVSAGSAAQEGDPVQRKGAELRKARIEQLEQRWARRTTTSPASLGCQAVNYS